MMTTCFDLKIKFLDQLFSTSSGCQLCWRSFFLLWKKLGFHWFISNFFFRFFVENILLKYSIGVWIEFENRFQISDIDEKKRFRENFCSNKKRKSFLKKQIVLWLEYSLFIHSIIPSWLFRVTTTITKKEHEQSIVSNVQLFNTKSIVTMVDWWSFFWKPIFSSSSSIHWLNSFFLCYSLFVIRDFHWKIIDFFLLSLFKN